MSPRTIALVASVTINLCLIWLIAVAYTRPVGGAGERNTPEPRAAPAQDDSRFPRAKRPSSSAPSTSSSYSLFWPNLDSEDARQFAANLKTAGCPEHIASPLVLARICINRDEKFARVPPCPPWADAGQTRAAKLRIWKARMAVREEADALARELTGMPVAERMKFDDDYLLGRGIMGAFIGTPRMEQLTQALLWLERMEMLSNELKELPPVACWREAQLLKCPWPGLPAGLFTPDEARGIGAQVLALRLVFEMNGDSDSKQFLWTAAELQRVSEAVAPNLPEVVHIENAMEDFGEAGLRKLVLNALSPDRAREWKRVADEDYRNAYRLAQKEKLDLKVAEQVYAIKEQVEALWMEILSDPALTEGEREARVRELRMSAGNSMRQVLGSKAGQVSRKSPLWPPGPEEEK